MSTALTRETAVWAAAEPRPLDGLYEVVDGAVVEKSVGTPETLLAGDLQGWLFLYLMKNPRGRSVVEMLFQMNPEAPRHRRPNLAFISNERLATHPPGGATPWRVAPDLVVEVVSEHDLFHDVFEKVDEYFAAGVRLVWLISQRLSRVYVLRSATDVKILTPGDELDGGDVLPGFRLPLEELFGRAG